MPVKNDTIITCAQCNKECSVATIDCFNQGGSPYHHISACCEAAVEARPVTPADCGECKHDGNQPIYPSPCTGCGTEGEGRHFEASDMDAFDVKGDRSFGSKWNNPEFKFYRVPLKYLAAKFFKYGWQAAIAHQREVLLKSQKAIAGVLGDGGCDSSEWFDDLVEAQQCIAAAIRAGKEQADE